MNIEKMSGNGRIKDIDIAHEAAIAADYDATDATRSRRIANGDKEDGHMVGYERYSEKAALFDAQAIEAAVKVVDAHDEVEYEDMITFQEAIEELSYTDVLNEEEARGAIEFTTDSPNGKKYTLELQRIAEQYGWAEIKQLAIELRDECLDIMKSLGIPPSKFAESLSWAVWDIAKQHYFAEHPDEVSDDYGGRQGVKPANPLEDSKDGGYKRHEIIGRHLGWEIDLAIREGRYSLDMLHGYPRQLTPDIAEVLEKGERNETGQLRSYELAKLGRRVYRIARGGYDPNDYIRRS